MSQHFDETKIRRDGGGKFATKGFSEADGGTEASLPTTDPTQARIDTAVEQTIQGYREEYLDGDEIDEGLGDYGEDTAEVLNALSQTDEGADMAYAIEGGDGENYYRVGAYIPESTFMVSEGDDDLGNRANGEEFVRNVVSNAIRMNERARACIAG